ncbi:hypothetical protein LZZ90_06740 [Flavobacterium sp. SM15]|uniref:hypothetical protein n=1 Tax=Flavobacterium sp. SM15 TaxID=2908005 RepID=UPI001EDC2BCC|nr:hypothetical protein [Flavobacterium sp. SM15]MCG2611199.1 hypothetical protein [Flavobacterium sp. SM15]
MKRVFNFLILAILLVFAIGCDDNDDTVMTNNNSQLIAAINSTVTSGTWKVTLFNDSGTDETNHFAGYNFTFASGGVLTATNGTNTYTGIWSVTDSNSNDDNPDDVHFNIQFTTPVDFTDLTDDWHVSERTDAKIRLMDVSGGGGGTDLLTFEKN